MDLLRKCEGEVARLEAENEYLRDAAREFGELAERLNDALGEERRNSIKRDGQPRAAAERRSSRVPHREDLSMESTVPAPRPAGE